MDKQRERRINLLKARRFVREALFALRKVNEKSMEYGLLEKVDSLLQDKKV